MAFDDNRDDRIRLWDCAPEMLAILKELMDFRVSDPLDRYMADRIMGVIAKAEGVPPVYDEPLIAVASEGRATGGGIDPYALWPTPASFA